MTALLAQSEIRGIDATGYWGTENGGKDRIFYHKEPMNSANFVQTDIWNSLKGVDLNLMVAHARGASQGVGHPHFNQNNHPFVSSDYTMAVVHNGRVPDQEYHSLRQKYQVNTECDSEILLRILEANELTCDSQEDYDDPFEWNLSRRLHSIKNVWSQVIKGQMAVCMGEWLPEDNRRLWLFRNKFRPLWLIDLRKTLGQIFFCSTPDIWQSASNSCPSMRPFLNTKIKLIEVPTEEVWVMRISEKNPTVSDDTVRKFKVKTEGLTPFAYTGEPISVTVNSAPVEVVTGLGPQDVVKHPGVPKHQKELTGLVNQMKNERPTKQAQRQTEDMIQTLRNQITYIDTALWRHQSAMSLSRDALFMVQADLEFAYSHLLTAFKILNQ